MAVDHSATEVRRQEIRDRRKQEARPTTKQPDTSPQNGWRRLLKFHAGLEIAGGGNRKMIRCVRCGHLFCNADDNYKLYSLHQIIDLNEIMPPLASGEPYIGEYHIYSCPVCAAQLQVDIFSPTLGGDAVLWDTRIDAARLRATDAKLAERGAK